MFSSVVFLWLNQIEIADFSKWRLGYYLLVLDTQTWQKWVYFLNVFVILEEVFLNTFKTLFLKIKDKRCYTVEHRVLNVSS